MTGLVHRIEESDEILRTWRSMHLRLDQRLGQVHLSGAYGQDWATAQMDAECFVDKKEKAQQSVSYANVVTTYYTGSYTRRVSKGSAAKCITNDRRSAKRHGGMGCGIYSHLDPRGVMQNLDNFVVATCINWGAVAVGTNGVRAEHVRMERIDLLVQQHNQLAEVIVAMLAEKYDIPVAQTTINEFRKSYGIAEEPQWTSVSAYEQYVSQNRYQRPNLLQRLLASPQPSQSQNELR